MKANEIMSKQLESEREAAASAEATSQANAGKAARQSELETQAGRTKGLFASKAARRRSRSSRSGRRGRRSLLTSSGGGMGYFSRFL